MMPSLFLLIILLCTHRLTLAFQQGIWSPAFIKCYQSPISISRISSCQVQDANSYPVASTNSKHARTAATAILFAWPWDDGEELVTQKEEAIKAAEAEALRYENRAASLESALKNRTKELKLMKNRVIILQDVARKLKSSQNNTLTELKHVRQEAMERHEIEETLNATYDELDRQTTRLQRLLDDEKRARKEVARQYDELVNELELKDMEGGKIQGQMNHDLSELERRLKSERRGRKKDRGEFENIKRDLESRLEAVTAVAKDLELELNRTVADIETLRRENNRDDQEIRDVVKEEKRKRQFMKQELVAARMAEREAVEELERMQERFEKQKKIYAARDREREKNATQFVESQRIRQARTPPQSTTTPPPKDDVALKRAEEKVEIATAAVHAAEKREEEARARVSKVQGELRSLVKENDRLSIELRGALDGENSAMERLENFKGLHGGREESLKKRVVRAEQNLRRVEEEMNLLRSERDDIREALLSERLKFSSERREEQLRYDRIMSDEREGYETEISLLKEQLSRQAGSIRKQSEMIQLKQEIRTDIEDEQPRVTEKPKRKTRSRLGRALKWVVSPKSWFSG